MLANLFKYPFFRFGVQYTLGSGKTLLEGYQEKGRAYLLVFFVLNIFAEMINTAGVSIVCAAILKFIFMALGLPFDLSIGAASTIIIAVTWGILLLGQYRFLDTLSKGIMIALTVSTVTAVIVAALIQYGSGEPVEAAGVAYIGQFIKMYAFAIGDWSKLLIAFIAFMCMFGTTITVIDGYSRANDEALRLLRGKEERSPRSLNLWITVTTIVGIVIILGFMSNVAAMLTFAMICSFISTPFFAFLNFSLVLGGKNQRKDGFFWLAICGLLYLSAFTMLFIVYETGLLG